MSTIPAECAERVERLRARMRGAGVDGLIVTDPVMFQYCTGQKAIAGGVGRVSAFILPLDGAPGVVDWSGASMFARLYRRPPPTWVADCRIYPEVPFNHDERVDWGIRDLLVERGLAQGTLAIELGNEPRLGLAVNDFERLKADLPGARFVDSSAIVWAVRMIKSAWEIDKLRRACAIGARSWKAVLDGLHIGISAQEIQKRALAGYIEHGADLDSPPPLVLGATGPGGTFQRGDILYLDGGCAVAGYKMDFTRRAVFGPPSERQRAEHDGMWDILFQVMARMKPGVATAEIFAYSQSLMAKTPWTNYSSHPSLRIGHGIGLVNEPPYLNAFDRNVLAAGMSITPEPKIETVEGLLNAEEHVIVGENGCEVLSAGLDWRLRVVD